MGRRLLLTKLRSLHWHQGHLCTQMKLPVELQLNRKVSIIRSEFQCLVMLSEFLLIASSSIVCLRKAAGNNHQECHYGGGLECHLTCWACASYYCSEEDWSISMIDRGFSSNIVNSTMHCKMKYAGPFEILWEDWDWNDWLDCWVDSSAIIQRSICDNDLWALTANQSTGRWNCSLEATWG